MKRIAIIVSIILAVVVSGSLITAFAVAGPPEGMAASSEANFPKPPTAGSASTPAPKLEITNSQAAEAQTEEEEAAPLPQPAPVVYEGGTSPASNGSALEGSWHYYEDVNANDEVLAYQYRFYNESNNMNLNYGTVGAEIGVNMLGTFSLSGDGTLVLSDVTWSSKDNLLGHTGGQAVFTLGWPADGQDALVITLQSYETGDGVPIPVFDHIVGVPLLCGRFGQPQVDLG